MRHPIAIIFVLLLLLLSGCNSSDESGEPVTTDFRNIESTVESIHKLFNQQQFDKLYNYATVSAKNNFRQKQFVSFAEYLRSTLGRVKNAEIADQTEISAGKQAVILEVQYENEKGTERWILEQAGNEWHWAEFQYNAESLNRGN